MRQDDLWADDLTLKERVIVFFIRLLIFIMSVLYFFQSGVLVGILNSIRKTCP